MYRQKPIKGGRTPISAAIIGKIDKCVRADARRFNVGNSFVVATILAHHYNISEQEDYKTVERNK